jgi:phosphate starvation-inducible protein PhoH and related proteins
MSKRKNKKAAEVHPMTQKNELPPSANLSKCPDPSSSLSAPSSAAASAAAKLVNRPKYQGHAPKMRTLVYRPNQQRFIDTFQEPETKIIILIGPAGTGKTLMAVRKGLEGIINGRFADLVLCRPIVEAGGEELGSLPGTVDEKIGPYLEPFYDKLTAFLPEPMLKALLNAKHITATPLAYMRGRTFSESMVIIDEAQNTSIEQIKMAVTRLGPFSKMVICGDPDQSDIRGMNGLQYITSLFEREGEIASSNGCHVCRLGVEDIQRNSVIPFLLDAFTRFKASLDLKVERKSSNTEERVAALLERSMNYLMNHREDYIPSAARNGNGHAHGNGARGRNGRSHHQQNGQGDLFVLRPAMFPS